MHQRNRALIAVLLLGAIAGCQRSRTPESVVTGLTAAIFPSFASLDQCTSVQLAVTVRDLSGDPVPTDSMRWSSSDSTLVSVSAGGLVRALHPSPGVTIRVVVYHDALQASAQTVLSVTSNSQQPYSCPTQ
jgi:uncharacterized protein YjdB